MQHRVALGLLLVVTAVVYLPSLGYGFVYEDLRSMTDTLTWSGWSARALFVYEHPLRSLTVVSRDVNIAVFGIQPWSLHLGNVLIHLANVWLVWRVASQVGLGQAAWWAAALFALHPMQVEAVTYVSARSDLLSVTGVLLALWATSVGSVAGAVAGVALAVLGKETAVVAFALVPLWAFTTRAKFPLAVWLVVGVILVPLVWVATKMTPAFSLDDAQESLVAAWRLFSLWVVPVGFSIEHDWRVWAWTAPLFMVPTVVLTLWAVTRRSWGAFAWLWTVLALSPRVLPLYEGLHERHMYLVSIGWCLCAGSWLGSYAQRRTT